MSTCLFPYPFSRYSSVVLIPGGLAVCAVVMLSTPLATSQHVFKPVTVSFLLSSDVFDRERFCDLDLDLDPMILQTFLAVDTHTSNVCGKFR